jgi:hypothetical protein
MIKKFVRFIGLGLVLGTSIWIGFRVATRYGYLAGRSHWILTKLSKEPHNIPIPYYHPDHWYK